MHSENEYTEDTNCAAAQPAAALYGPTPSEADLPGWGLFWRFLCANAGVLFFMAGVICFFAYNWEHMPHFAKFACIGAVMTVAGLISLRRGLSGMAGSLGLLACGIAGGVLLAVFGQTYQTGANMWELFRTWSLFLLPLAILGRSAGLCFALWITVGLWGFFYLGQRSIVFEGNDYQALYILYQVAGHGLAFLLWESAAAFLARPSLPFLQARWLPRVIGTSLLFLLTVIVGALIVEPRDNPFNFAPAYAALYCITIVSGAFFYYRKRPDLLLLACGMMSLTTLLLLWLFTMMEHQNEIGLILLMLITLVACAVGAAKILIHCHKMLSRVNGEGAFPGDTGEHADAPPSPNLARQAGWKDAYTARMRLTLQGLGHSSGQSSGQGPGAPGQAQPSPWQARLLLGACAWISMPLLIALMVTIFGSLFDLPGYIVVFLLMLAGGAALSHQQGIFFQQAALCLSLTGAAATSGLLAAEFDLNRTFLIPALLIFSAGFKAVEGSAFRFIAAVVVMTAVFLQAAMLMPPDMATEGAGLFASYLVFLFGFTVFCLWAVRYWLRRSAQSTVHLQHEPLMAAQFATLLVLGIFTPVMQADLGRLMTNYFLWPMTLFGPAAGIGLAYFCHALCKELQLSRPTRLGLTAVAAATALAGWWLPWLSAGLLVLALGRRAGSLVIFGIAVLYLGTNTVLEYYRLALPLLHKSFVLGASGLAFMLVALALHIPLKKAFAPGGTSDEAAPLPRAAAAGLSATSGASPAPRFGRPALALVLLLFFIGFGIAVQKKETLLAEGREVVLALRPLDPRSLMQGDYMILALAVENDIQTALRDRQHAEHDPSPVLQATAIAAPDQDGVYAFRRLDDGAPLAADETRLIFRNKKGGIRVGSGAFFFQEGRATAYNAARYALMRVNPDTGETLVYRLLDADKKEITPGTAAP